MKLIIILDVGDREYKKIKELFKESVSVFVDGRKKYLEAEYNHLQKIISANKSARSGIMIMRFSGDHEIAKEIGDESNELVVFMSANKDNPCYVDNREDVIRKLIETIE